MWDNYMGIIIILWLIAE